MKQCRSPCSGFALVPVYQDLSAHHVWPAKKDIVNLPVRLKRLIRNAFSSKCVKFVKNPEQGFGHCFADFTNQG